MAKFEYQGIEVEYDETAFTDYSVMRGIALYRTDPTAYFEAMARIFMGRDAEYSRELGDSMEAVAALFAACAANAGEQAKN